MLRRIHGLPGLVLAIALTVLAVTGAWLSVMPALDRIGRPDAASGVSVAALAEAVATRHASVDRIRQRPDGTFTASWSTDTGRAIERIDPTTGADLGPYQISDATRFMTNLHRSFFAGDAGRIAAGIGAGAMVLLTVSGLALMVRRQGGWTALAKPIRGNVAERLHGELGRLAALGLLLSAATGIWMTASTFGLLPERTETAASVAVTVNGGTPLAVGRLPALRRLAVTDLRDLTFPAAGDPSDAWSLKTTAGEGAVDQATGEWLAFTPTGTLERIGDIVVMLHTGRGAWVLGLVLGLSAASVPVFGVTGLLMWHRRRQGRSAIAGNVAARSADTVILVGSEGNTTWGFAATLHAALTAAGHRVHTAPMNALAPIHVSARRMLILTATYGDGAAPASAATFLERLEEIDATMPVAVLGFGDRTFPNFCRFAADVTAALDARGWPRLLAPKRIDRRSAQEFAQWGHDLGAVLGHELTLEHTVAAPRTTALELVQRMDYGAAVGAPVAILRFRAAETRGVRGLDFEAGDLLGVVVAGSSMPRFYSLASSARDGMVEICVRLRDGGLCSTLLHGLEPGDRIAAFVRPNPTFRPASGRAPLILIGAGAGIGPLTGFVRANDDHRAVHLYWGGRSPSSDFLYEHELARHLAEERLTSLDTAFSRGPNGAYVQDRIAADGPRLRELIRHGAQVLVCGGRDMASAVTHTFDAVIHPLGLDVATLKSSGRYVEDVY